MLHYLRSVPGVLLLSLLAPCVAAADNVCVQLQNGGETGGALREYVPGDHISLDAGDGTLLRIEAAATTAVHITADEQAPCAHGSAQDGATLPPPSASGPFNALQVDQLVSIQQLLLERHAWATRYTSLLIPKTLIPVGVLTVGIGWFVFTRGDEHKKPGRILLWTGAASILTALLSLPFRTRIPEQTEKMQRIDRQLHELGATARLSPWLAPEVGRGFAAGIGSSLHF